MNFFGLLKSIIQNIYKHSTLYLHSIENTGKKDGISLMILLKMDEYCSAEVADISSKVNSLLTTHSNNPLHE